MKKTIIIVSFNAAAAVYGSSRTAGKWIKNKIADSYTDVISYYNIVSRKKTTFTLHNH